MLLGRRALVLCLALGLALGDVRGVSAALCRVLCDLRGCHESEAAASAEGGSCCRERERSGLHLAVKSETRERCGCSVKAPSRAPTRGTTSPVADASARLATSLWLRDAAPAPSAIAETRAGSKRGPPGGTAAGGPNGSSGHAAFGGRWSTVLLGCARI